MIKNSKRFQHLCFKISIYIGSLIITEAQRKDDLHLSCLLITVLSTDTVVQDETKLPLIIIIIIIKTY